jgi:Fe2+ or Zn2+ uptake regulation protein
MSSDEGSDRRTFNTADRKSLFLELASAPGGASPVEVYRRARESGDTVTEEAYYNVARRLAHRGLLVAVESDKGTRYKLGAHTDDQWLEEEELHKLIDPEYPILAVTVWKESRRQLNEVPEEVWMELQERLRLEPAPEIFRRAIVSYCEDFRIQVADLVLLGSEETVEVARLRREAENSRLLLLRLAKYGLGLSKEAVNVPLTLDLALSEFRKDARVTFVDEAILAEELSRRVSPEDFIVEARSRGDARDLLIGAVDGSTRGGLLSFLGEESDFGIGHVPMIAINTSIGQVNRSLQVGGRSTPVFTRLPEKPEDMQRQDNRYTLMAKLLYPDLSDAEYMHSVWNAMDLIESKAALRLLKRWYGPRAGVEVAPSDVVMRDGTVSPQDRDFNHYAEISSYGLIVRDMIETNWEIACKCRDNAQTVAGVVKAAQLSVFAPVVNWFACQVAGGRTSQLLAWPLHTMNMVPDQAILTRLLTAGRKKGATWNRTCIVQRPFHALTNYARAYSRSAPPSRPVLDAYESAAEAPESVGQEKRLFWETFRPDGDPYVKMLDNVFYGSFFLATVPRLDIDKNLPRFEFLVPASTIETGPDPWASAVCHRDRLISAIRQTGFEVSKEHSMFQSAAKVDVLPSLLIQAHDTVKLWAAELLSRVQEYIGYYLARYVNAKKSRGIRVRPFTRDELKFLYSQLRMERELKAGASDPSSKLDD